MIRQVSSSNERATSANPKPEPSPRTTRALKTPELGPHDHNTAVASQHESDSDEIPLPPQSVPPMREFKAESYHCGETTESGSDVSVIARPTPKTAIKPEPESIHCGETTESGSGDMPLQSRYTTPKVKNETGSYHRGETTESGSEASNNPRPTRSFLEPRLKREPVSPTPAVSQPSAQRRISSPLPPDWNSSDMRSTYAVFPSSPNRPFINQEPLLSTSLARVAASPLLHGAPEFITVADLGQVPVAIQHGDTTIADHWSVPILQPIQTWAVNAAVMELNVRIFRLLSEENYGLSLKDSTIIRGLFELLTRLGRPMEMPVVLWDPHLRPGWVTVGRQTVQWIEEEDLSTQ